MKIAINGHGASIVIAIIGSENPSSENPSDANWLTCSVAIDIGGFAANYPAAFTTSDFARFRCEIKTALAAMNGTASFITDESALQFTAEIGRTGTVIIKGQGQVFGHTRATLSFSFESDQTFFAETIRCLDAVVRQYPVIEQRLPGQQ